MSLSNLNGSCLGGAPGVDTLATTAAWWVLPGGLPPFPRQ